MKKRPEKKNGYPHITKYVLTDEKRKASFYLGYNKGFDDCHDAFTAFEPDEEELKIIVTRAIKEWRDNCLDRQHYMNVGIEHFVVKAIDKRLKGGK